MSFKIVASYFISSKQHISLTLCIRKRSSFFLSSSFFLVPTAKVDIYSLLSNKIPQKFIF